MHVGEAVEYGNQSEALASLTDGLQILISASCILIWKVGISEVCIGQTVHAESLYYDGRGVD